MERIFVIMHSSMRPLLKQHPILPLVTLQKAEEALAIADRLLKKNIRIIEIGLRSDAALKGIELLAKQRPEITVLAGTVITPEQFQTAMDYGAKGMVSPGFRKSLHEIATKTRLPWLPGVVTPSEIMKALEKGYDTLKFFPANVFGGIEALKALVPVFPQVQFCVTGGINDRNKDEYLAFKNVIAVSGSQL